jgi:hypothetical protein
MRTQLKSMLLPLGISFMVLSGCKKSDGLVSPSVQSANNNIANTNVVVATPLNPGKPIPVTITMTITGGVFPTFTGPITTTGDLIPPGEGSMYVNSFGNVFHCIITLVTSEGKITIREECNKTTFMGQWQIAEGTGAYVNLRGNGKVMMPRGFEVLEGVIYWIG